MALDKPYLDIPGTTVFDADQSRRGYHLNQCCMSLMKAENRARFKQDEAAYLADWALTDAQREALLARQYNRLIELGGNVYFLAKLFFTDEMSFEKAASLMTGMAQEDYRAMMIAGGRPIEGNRYQHEWAADRAAKEHK